MCRSTLSPPRPRSDRHFWTIFSGFPEAKVLMMFLIGIFRRSFTDRVSHFQLKCHFLEIVLIFRFFDNCSMRFLFRIYQFSSLIKIPQYLWVGFQKLSRFLGKCSVSLRHFFASLSVNKSRLGPN